MQGFGHGDGAREVIRDPKWETAGGTRVKVRAKVFSVHHLRTPSIFEIFY